MLSRISSEAKAWALFAALRFQTARTDFHNAADRLTDRVGNWLVNLLSGR